MKMEVTPRDMKILQAALILLVVVLMLRLAILPAIEQRQTLHQELTTAQELAERMQQKIDEVPNNRARIERGTAELKELSAPYYDIMENQEIDRLVTGLVLEHNLFPSHLSISAQTFGVPEAYYLSLWQTGTESEEEEVTVASDVESAAAAAEAAGEDSPAQAEDAGDQDGAIRISEASISMTGSEGQLYALLSDIEENYPSIQVRSFKIKEQTYMDGTLRPVEELQAEFVLAVYMVEKGGE